ncbi:MAG: citrate/tricarballylate utilization protein [Alphaproteobacteria bacterium]|jgi:citrate/tricarballylate utilization protein
MSKADTTSADTQPCAPTRIDILAEAERQMNICNACRYCEGHCAVFPAMEMRLRFTEGDLGYLANLCHDCRACYEHCQYVPPHEFAVNLPQALSQVRTLTYTESAWPSGFGRMFHNNGLMVGLLTALALAIFMTGAVALIDPAALWGRHTGAGAFYAVIPHGVMVWSFGAAFAYAVIALSVAVVRFWRQMGAGVATAGESAGTGPCLSASAQALHDGITLKYMSGANDGGGEGCTYPDETPSAARRWCHHLTAGGFMLCFAATSVATLYHYLFGWVAPYAFTALPVVLGIAGGIGLIIGPLGLLWLRGRANPAPGDPARTGMDAAFILMLLATSVTGLALLIWRESPAMGVLLTVHLGVVMGLFVTLPYGKFVHGFLRLAALARYALEKRKGAAL